MWIGSVYGWFSIVKKGEGWHVRARKKRDLTELRARALVSAKVHHWSQADYPYRMVVDNREFTRIMIALQESVQYGNFKAQIALTPDQKSRAAAYHRVWGIMIDESEGRLDSPARIGGTAFSMLGGYYESDFD